MDISSSAQNKVYLQELFDSEGVTLEAKDGDVYYVQNPQATDLVRVASVTTATTGLTDTTYTVADGSIFRVGEKLLVYSSADVYKGGVRVTETDTLTVTVRNDNGLTLASGDKLYYKEDDVVTDGNVVAIDTRRIQSAIFKASENCSLFIEKEDLRLGILKKKI
jgi:hypothetical protein